MDIRTLTSFEDVLNSELESIFGGNEPLQVHCLQRLNSELESIFGGNEPIKVECKGDGIVEVPTNPEKATMMLTVF